MRKPNRAADEIGKWCIMWETRDGFRSRGSALLTLHAAQIIAEVLNRDYPMVHHWIERADTPIETTP
jgi:hypothetical protein